MPIYILPKDEIIFPPPHLATAEGILAVGGDLSSERLLTAYRQGIFPWFNPGEPILWWSPDPRFVLYPAELRVSKSMRPYFNQQKFKVTFDRAFDRVIEACQVRASEAERRQRDIGSWITAEMREAYNRLHHMGYAHSVEVWEEEQLVGGLYGLAIGAVFFGESMFTRVSNASKFGFIHLVLQLEQWGYKLIDCQQETQHLTSLGARSIPRAVFLNYLKRYVNDLDPGRWEE